MKLHNRGGGSVRWARTGVRIVLAGAAAAVICGCADASLRAARHSLAASDYATAHQELTAAENDPHLSTRHRREVLAGLCLTEDKLGAPAYPPAEQLSACRAAAATGDTDSVARLEAIAASQRKAEAERIDQAIAQNNLGDAEAAIARYLTLDGADQHAVAGWSHQLWAIVSRDDADSARARRHSLQPAVARAVREYPKVHAMSDQAFARWVRQNMRVDGASLVSSVKMSQQTVTMRIPDNELNVAATNLDRFARINDALIARCGCDGRTNVSLQRGELPAYLVRLDPATHRSEVLVLVQR